MKKIVVLTSGGDAPGMNAALRSVVRTAIHYGMEVLGSENGFDGLVKEKLIPLNPRSMANIIHSGGTILKTRRSPRFRQPEVRARVREFLTKNKVDGLVVLGGDGSFNGAATLKQEGGPNVIGIPCTIDNDIVNTDYCIGFDTACNTAIEAIDKIRDTALSLDRNFMIEVMGRASGFIAVEVGIAAGAEFILIPEFPKNIDDLSEEIKHQSGKKLTSIIVAAESGQPGHTFELANQIKEKTGIEYKVCVLGHIQRGGTPTVKDRVMGTIMGAKAIHALASGQTNQMMAVKAGDVTCTPFPNPGETTRFYNDVDSLELNRIICQI